MSSDTASERECHSDSTAPLHTLSCGWRCLWPTLAFGAWCVAGSWSGLFARNPGDQNNWAPLVFLDALVSVPVVPFTMVKHLISASRGQQHERILASCS